MVRKLGMTCITIQEVEVRSQKDDGMPALRPTVFAVVGSSSKLLPSRLYAGEELSSHNISARMPPLVLHPFPYSGF